MIATASATSSMQPSSKAARISVLKTLLVSSRARSAQRLVRTIFEYCVRAVHYDEDALSASGLDPAEWRDFEFCEGAGCIECGGTGYRGRTAIHELLDLTDPIREMILDKKPTSEVRRLAQQEGMKFLRESAIDRVRRGLTTLKEINKVTFIEASR